MSFQVALLLKGIIIIPLHELHSLYEIKQKYVFELYPRFSTFKYKNLKRFEHLTGLRSSKRQNNEKAVLENIPVAT